MRLEQGEAEEGRRGTGILGGSFDPIHNAHLRLADCALEELGLSEICFLPAAHPYLHKHKDISPFEIRAEMTRLAIRGRRDFRLSLMEGEREGPSYTVDTLRILRERCPGESFTLIIGADQLYELENWHEPSLLFRLSEIAAARRDSGRRERSLLEQAEYLRERYGARIHLLSMEETEISSSRIREMVRRGEDISGLVPESVLCYIREKGLWRS